MQSNGAHAPGTDLDVIEVREHSPIDAYLESSRRTRDRIVDELTDLRDSEAQLEVELTRQASEARARRSNYQRALDALGKGTAAKPKPKPTAKVPRKGRAPWDISDEKVNEIEARFRELIAQTTMRTAGDVPVMTANHLGQSTPGLSTEAARKGLEILRDREVIRVAGPARGGGVLYALMPEDADGN